MCIFVMYIYIYSIVNIYICFSDGISRETQHGKIVNLEPNGIGPGK